MTQVAEGIQLRFLVADASIEARVRTATLDSLRLWEDRTLTAGGVAEVFE